VLHGLFRKKYSRTFFVTPQSHIGKMSNPYRGGGL
jgi:hypothetical protein